jgi:repressor LexA
VISERQKRILDFICQYIRQKGYPPTIYEIGRAVGLSSPDSVAYNLKALEHKGYIQRLSGKSRSVKVIKGDLGDKIPILGRVAAGTPLYAEENIEGFLELSQESFRPGKYFALKIRGDSMIEKGILDGDYVVVREQRVATSGDIVVALIDQEATVKQLLIKDDQIQLKAANPAYQPIKVERERDDFGIIGKVVAVVRFL